VNGGLVIMPEGMRMTESNVKMVNQMANAEFISEHVAAASISGNDTHDPFDMIDCLPVVEIAISVLERGLFQRSSGTDPTHVKLLADVACASELPPILVQKNNFRVVDGMHRLEAAKMRGETIIRARLVSCSDEDAFILAVKSNTLHGLPLSRTDRIFGAQQILAWHPEWSDRAVGVASGLGTRAIAALRCRLDASGQPSGKRLGRDGKRHPVAGIEGRRRAADYIASRPDASLREIARAVDVSLGTARDVRARLQRGLEPVTVGQQASSAGSSVAAQSTSNGRPPENGPRDVRRIAVGRDWGTISAKLMNDPSLKYSEGGRAFIRWMALYAAHASEWREYIDAVPAHWMTDVSLVADSVREELAEFADQLRRRQNLASFTACNAPLQRLRTG
jgi:ParB-like chromosome segregation protein Spo0J